MLGSARCGCSVSRELNSAATDAYSRTAFPASGCSQWGHGNAKGIMFGFSDGWDGTFPVYGTNNMVISGRHWDDRAAMGGTNVLDSAIWVR